MSTLRLWTGPLLSGKNLPTTLALVLDILLRKTIRKRLVSLSWLLLCSAKEMTHWILTNVGPRLSMTAVSWSLRQLCKILKPGPFNLFQTSVSTSSLLKTMNNWLYVVSNSFLESPKDGISRFTSSSRSYLTLQLLTSSIMTTMKDFRERIGWLRS